MFGCSTGDQTDLTCYDNLCGSLQLDPAHPGQGNVASGEDWSDPTACHATQRLVPDRDDSSEWLVFRAQQVQTSELH